MTIPDSEETCTASLRFSRLVGFNVPLGEAVFSIIGLGVVFVVKGEGVF